jgi:hypothetical protein
MKHPCLFAILAATAILSACAPKPSRPQGGSAAGAASTSPLATLKPTVAPSPSPTPVVYVPVETSPASALPTGSGIAEVAQTPRPAYGAPAPKASMPSVQVTLAPSAQEVHPIAEPADAPPRILAMTMSSSVVHSGDVVSGTVQTTSNVASVEARIAGFSSALRKVGVGTFTLSYRVPRLPFFLKRTWTIDVVARNTRGDAVRSSIPITVR